MTTTSCAPRSAASRIRATYAAMRSASTAANRGRSSDTPAERAAAARLSAQRAARAWSLASKRMAQRSTEGEAMTLLSLSWDSKLPETVTL